MKENIQTIANTKETKKDKEKKPNYALRRAGAAAALAGTVAAGAIGINRITSSDNAAPEAERYVLAQQSAEVQKDQNVNTIAIQLGNNIVKAVNKDPQATLDEEQQSAITTQLKGKQEFSVVNPGNIVTVTLGETDGKPDSDGDFGTDFTVDVDKGDGG